MEKDMIQKTKRGVVIFEYVYRSEDERNLYIQKNQENGWEIIDKGLRVKENVTHATNEEDYEWYACFKKEKFYELSE